VASDFSENHFFRFTRPVNSTVEISRHYLQKCGPKKNPEEKSRMRVHLFICFSLADSIKLTALKDWEWLTKIDIYSSKALLKRTERLCHEKGVFPVIFWHQI